MNSPFKETMKLLTEEAEQAHDGSDLCPTPVEWFAERFPRLDERYGDAVEIEQQPDRSGCVTGINEDFFAATLGDLGTPDAPTVFVKDEGRFYCYDTTDGIFVPRSEQEIHARLSELLLSCAEACKLGFDVSALEFRFRRTSALKGVVDRAKGLLAVDQSFFNGDLQEFIPCRNGMLRLATMTLESFAAQHRRRSKIAADFDPKSSCPMFLDTLMKPAIDASDLDLLQRWCGLALVGVNLAQTIMILTGTAKGGKGTFVRVLVGIIGSRNVGMLRTNQLAGRFEIGGMLGRSLLHGPDVRADFLSGGSAHALKALTGGDPLTGEIKGCNERPQIPGLFNVVVTSNSRLAVRLEGDHDAWSRRLRMVSYDKPPPENVIHDLSEQILRKESSGVLNWMLEGLKRLREAGWQLTQTTEQARRVEDLLRSSDSCTVFVHDGIVRDENATLTTADCFQQYVHFCEGRSWVPMTVKQFGDQIYRAVEQSLGLPERHDIIGRAGKLQRGWKGIRCR